MKKTSNIFDHTDCISEEMLIRHVSGKLSSAEKREVEKHLLDCEMCSDAVEGLAMVEDPNRISKITSELNERIQQRVEKKVIKVNFLQQYRSQLAIAASVVVLLGLVFFFRSNMSMKELDQESSDKIFAEKFEAPPADIEALDMEEAEKDAGGKEQARAEYPASAAAQEPSKVLADEQDLKEGAKTGKDANSGESFGWAEKEALAAEEIPLQKAQQEKFKASVTEDSRSKNAEVTVKQNSTVDLKSRDDDASLAGKKQIAENRNELQSVKEKDQKTESRPQAVPAATTATGGSVSDNYNYTQPVTDKSISLSKKDSKKPAEESKKSEETVLDRESAVQGDVLALESVKKTGGKMRGKRKENTPEKPAGYYETGTNTASPAPEVQSKMAQQGTGAKTDSVSALTTAEDEAAGLDAGMVKYDKQDYAGALTDFEETLKQNPKDEKALFYSAVSYLSLGQTEKAVANLNKVLENKEGTYYDSAQWYLSLAYIKNNDTKNARKNLVELQNNSNSRYQKQADETLKQIQK